VTEGILALRDQGIKRQQLPEEVAAYARELIISGKVRPGEFLRLERIAEAMGVSQTPVREGLLTLSSEGFVRLIPRRGFVVASFTRQDVHDLFWVQAQLAGELAARAAKVITPEQIAGLEAIDAEHAETVEIGDRSRIDDLGRAFHRTINLAADSRRLAFLLGSAVRQLPNRFYSLIEGEREETRVDHPALIEALRGHQAHKARTIMEGHILGRADQLIKVLDDRGLWGSREYVS
jgi:DNA-binding GntR family transcriptional regulator